MPCDPGIGTCMDQGRLILVIGGPGNGQTPKSGTPSNVNNSAGGKTIFGNESNPWAGTGIGLTNSPGSPKVPILSGLWTWLIFLAAVSVVGLVGYEVS